MVKSRVQMDSMRLRVSEDKDGKTYLEVRNRFGNQP